MTQQVLGTILTATSIAALGYGLWLAWVANASRRWPTAPGQIIEATLVSQRVAPEVPEKHRAAVRYRYKVGGRDYEGTRVTFSDFVWTEFRRAAVRLVAELAPGVDVAVYYHPSKPHRAVLRPGITLGLAVVPTIALLPLIIGLLFLAE